MSIFIVVKLKLSYFKINQLFNKKIYKKLRNRFEDFSETRHEVGGNKKCKKRSTAVFFRFLPIFSKAAHLCEKKPFLAIFGSFWDFAENPFEDFP